MPLENPDLSKPQSPTLRRELGVADGVALLVGICIGAGIYSTPQIIAGYASSFKVILSLWILVGVMIFISGLIYSELGTRLPHTGGEYVYLSRSFGPFAGFIFGWAQLFIIRTSSVAGLALITADYLGFFIKMDKFAHTAAALSVIAVLGTLNYIGIKQASFYQKISSLLKVSGLLALIAIGWILVRGHENHLAATAPPTGALGPIGNLVTPILLIFFTYGGWVRIGQVAEEMKNPRKTIPFSLILGIGSIIIMYILTNTLYHRTLGMEGVRGSTVVASDVATLLMGPIGATVISVLVILSITGGINGNAMSATRVYYAMAKDGLLFRWLDYVHPRFRTPSRAIVVHCSWAAVILLLRGNFENIISGQVFINLIFYSISGFAYFKIRKNKIGGENVFKAPFYPFLPILYLMFLLSLAAFRVIFSWQKSLADMAVVATGIPFYYFWKRRIRE